MNSGAPGAAPNLSIRARPPSPRRLSRKVLITGALAAPQVGVNIAGVAERAIQNELKRRTESAIRDLFKRKRPQD